MSTAIHTYHTDPKKTPALKRQTNISLLVPYLFPIGLIVYQLVRTGYDYRFVILSIAISLISLILLFLSIKKSNKRIDTMTLAVGDDVVTLTELGKREQQINIADITAVDITAKGIELKGKSTSKNAFVIAQEFEKFDQIKKLIEAKVAKRKR
ncbi:hypothetical protein [Mucilaginibacter polytrichastri]|uniref:DUF304 domain-containing protein n=1 Tax=Mucilaginibacter polytrichastri TaxID=1302689 RepID=A0A1Q6A6B8_9SPHI|nr:hypothetical protein [Mucilaginibacter polytrichastri]OKS89555.1 hypothetical protein RG47T_5039 [Mucilaginibacter polytrichastri]SFS70296.1 hypothetical protein SAMN04487890_10359 [Mucilaginibacter polytrichastri]